MSNELHIRPKYSFNRYKFITVERCENCGVIADEYFFMGDDVCPDCGSIDLKEIVARWEDDAPDCVWYNPFTWSIFAINGRWVERKLKYE